MRWSSFDKDYEKIHEQLHESYFNNFHQSPPWSTSPKTIDEFIDVCDARAKWEKENDTSIPAWWSCILTHSLFEEMAREIKEIRDAKRNT